MGIIQSRQVIQEQRQIAGRSVAVTVIVRGRAPGYWRIGFDAVMGLLRGMRLTLGYFFSPEAIVTSQYPENRATLKLTERFRGNLRFKFPNERAQATHAAYVEQLAHETETLPEVVAGWVRDEDEEQWYHNCTGCGKCEAACPNASIKVITREGEILEDRELDRFVWRLDSCMFCNACVQACPWDAIEMTPHFENAVFDRRLLVYNLNRLAGPRINLIQDTEDPALRDRMVDRRDRFGGPIPLNGFALPNLPAVLPNDPSITDETKSQTGAA